MNAKCEIYFSFVQDASIILLKYRAGATITNGAGETPLHIAARFARLSVNSSYIEWPNAVGRIPTVI